MEKDAYYFPHFCNARRDPKIKRVIKELGVEGYGIYFMLLEVLREQSDFRYPMQDIDLLADEFKTSEQKVATVIGNYKLFEIDEDDRFFSIKFDEYLQPYIAMKEQRRVAGIKSGEARRQRKRATKKTNENERLFNGSSTDAQRELNGSSTVAERERTGVERELNENEQSKEEESKVKESIYSSSTAIPNPSMLYQENIGTMSPIIADQLIQATVDLSDDLVCYAIEQAVNYNKRSWAYISKMLDSWICNNVKTRLDADNLKPRKQDKPGKYGANKFSDFKNNDASAYDFAEIERQNLEKLMADCQEE